MDQARTAPKGVKIGYILDKHNRTFSKSACDYVQNMAARSEPEYKTGAGVLFLSGPEYEDPAVLADSVEARKLDTIVAVYDEDLDAMAVCRHGPGPEGIDVVIKQLREGAEKGLTSWETMHGSICWENAT